MEIGFDPTEGKYHIIFYIITKTFKFLLIEWEFGAGERDAEKRDGEGQRAGDLGDRASRNSKETRKRTGFPLFIIALFFFCW